MTQQASAPENQSNEVNVKTAMEDIALIKRVISHSEINLRRLSWLFLVYGSAALAFLVLRIGLAFYTARAAGLATAADLNIILTAVSYAVSAALFILFLRRRGSIRKTENVYTMKLFDLWGVMLFAPVFLEILLIPVKAAVPSVNILPGNIALSCMQFGALCVCVFFTGHYISSRAMKIIGAALAVLFPLLFLIPFPFYDAADLSETAGALRVLSHFASKTNVISLLLPFVYVGMGIYSLKKQRGSVYGDE